MKLIIFNVKVKKYFSNFSVQVFEGMGYGEGELFVIIAPKIIRMEIPQFSIVFPHNSFSKK